MNKIDCREILDYVSMNYSNFQIDNNLFNMWFNELQQYDKDDVLNKIKEMISKDLYQMKPPTLMAIIKDIPKQQEKLDWNKGVAFCNYCGKGFNIGDVKLPNALAELHKHEDKCRSMNFIIKQVKKYKGIELTRKELWSYDDDKFEKVYNKTLELIKDNSIDKDEIERVTRLLNGV